MTPSELVRTSVYSAWALLRTVNCRRVGKQKEASRDLRSLAKPHVLNKIKQEKKSSLLLGNRARDIVPTNWRLVTNRASSGREAEETQLYRGDQKLRLAFWPAKKAKWRRQGRPRRREGSENMTLWVLRRTKLDTQASPKLRHAFWRAPNPLQF